MDFILIFGPHAVGKMTVGQALEKQTGYSLFHNHMSIELAAHLFHGFGSPEAKELSERVREAVFDCVSKSNIAGFIFTLMWAMEDERDWEYVNRLEELFVSRGHTMYFVELCADLDVRLWRNKTENRLQHKPTKRNMEWSEQMFLKTENRHRLNSHDGEIKKEHYIKINNTKLAPEEAASRICEAFRFTEGFGGDGL